MKVTKLGDKHIIVVLSYESIYKYLACLTFIGIESKIFLLSVTRSKLVNW